MSTQKPPSDYVRYALWSAGFTQPSEEIINKLYATGHPTLAVDALVAALRTYSPTRKALEFQDAMQQIVNSTDKTTRAINDFPETL